MKKTHNKTSLKMNAIYHPTGPIRSRAGSEAESHIPVGLAHEGKLIVTALQRLPRHVRRAIAASAFSWLKETPLCCSTTC